MTTGGQARYIFYDMRLQRSENGGMRPTPPLTNSLPSSSAETEIEQRLWSVRLWSSMTAFADAAAARDALGKRAAARLRPDINGAHASRRASECGPNVARSSQVWNCVFAKWKRASIHHLICSAVPMVNVLADESAIEFKELRESIVRQGENRSWFYAPKNPQP